MPIDQETAMSLPPWRALVRGARQREGRSSGATWLQLATAATDGTPRVRTLVFRGCKSAVKYAKSRLRKIIKNTLGAKKECYTRGYGQHPPPDPLQGCASLC